MSIWRISSPAPVAVGAAVFVLASATAAAVPTGAATSASAVSVSDPRNDLKSSPKPRRTQRVDEIRTHGKASQGPDILSVRYLNGVNRLQVTIRLTSVRWANELAVFARTPARGPYKLHKLEYFRELYDPKFVLGDDGYKAFSIDGKPACPGARARVYPKTNSVRLDVPRRCIDWPDDLTFITESRRYYEYIHNDPDDPSSVAVEHRTHVWQQDATRASTALERG